VIRIRYSSELQPGLHGRVERHGHDTFVYLLPGLTPQQRRAALRRMRQQGRMGISPRLPVAQLAAALLADRVRHAFGQAGAIVRVHPAGSTLPVMAVSVAITSFLVLSALDVHIVHLPPQAVGSAGIGSGPGGTAPVQGGGQSAGPSTGPSAGRSGGGKGPAGGATGSGISPTPSGAPVTRPITSPVTTGGTNPGPGPGTSPGPGTGPASSPSPAPGDTPSPGGQPSGSASSTPSARPSQQPSTGATSSGASSAQPAATPSASSGSGGSSSQVCVEVGSLGICVGL
jgi:hypothetical protein